MWIHPLCIRKALTQSQSLCLLSIETCRLILSSCVCQGQRNSGWPKILLSHWVLDLSKPSAWVSSHIGSGRFVFQPWWCLDAPAPIVRARPLALAASASCGTSFGLLWQPQNGGWQSRQLTELIKESQLENKPDLPPPSHCLLDEDELKILRTRPGQGTQLYPHIQVLHQIVLHVCLQKHSTLGSVVPLATFTQFYTAFHWCEKWKILLHLVRKPSEKRATVEMACTELSLLPKLRCFPSSTVLQPPVYTMRR